MNAILDELAERYLLALRDYFAGAGEAALAQAYELGRKALASEVGLLEMAALHQESLMTILFEKIEAKESGRLAKEGADFFTEALAPFEMSKRGLQDATVSLKSLNEELKRQVAERTKELRQREKALRVSEKRYRSLFEHAGSPVIVLDPDGTITQANERFFDVTGYMPQEVAGKMKLFSLIAPKERERAKRQCGLDGYSKRGDEA